jgi:membrane associated rhomboid family serine protease
VSQPDLFVVCKNCGSEVSPYVTECPYCGQRVRKRAPKLEREEPGADARPRERRKIPKLSRLRPSEIEGIAPDTRPVATFLLIGLSIVGALIYASASGTLLSRLILSSPLEDDPWRYVSSLFLYDSLAYMFAALVTLGVFGTLLERRFGWPAPILVFLVAGAAGALASMAIGPVSAGWFRELFPLNGVLLQGGNGAVLGVLAAWVVDDRRAARQGDERGNDLIGVAVIAALMLLIPVAVTEADIVAGVVGALTGALVAPLLRLLPRRA